MRKLLLILVALLTLSGLLIAYGKLPDPIAGWQKASVLGHTWGGLVFVVVFILYAWDHVGTNRRWLRVWAGLTLSGLLQLTVGVVLILTGLVMLAYAGHIWNALRWLHNVLTYVLIASLTWHWLSPKRWRGPAPPRGAQRRGN